MTMTEVSEARGGKPLVSLAIPVLNEQDNLDMARFVSGQDAALNDLMVGRGDIRHFGSDAGFCGLLFSDE